MRKKLVFGLIALLAVTAVAGERYFNRANGQDIPLPKAPEPEKKDLFELLKKDLEGKKDEPTFPSLPPLKKDTADAPPTLPSLPAKKDDKVLITPPSSPVADTPKPATLPMVSNSQPEASKQDLTPPPLEGKKEAAPTFPPLPANTEKAPQAPKKDTAETPNTKPSESLPPLAPLTKQPKEPAKLDPIKPQNQGSATFDFTAPKDPPAPDVKPSTAPQAVTLPKNSPWSLNVVMVDGQTIVTAIVNKKHEFKILCQTLDLQTGKGTLKASGKVRINGDALNGTCENLTISLMEDRLLLEGKALISIDRTSSNVSDTTPASFELKGDTLNLRINEILSPFTANQPLEARHVSRNDTPSRVVTASMKLDGTQWTPYGRLRAVKSSENMWSLEGSNGAVIAYLLTREGGSLERYVGQSISVYGTREREHAGQPVLRVSHIALP